MMRRSERQSGVALIVVLSVLTMLIVIATPFLLQARKDYETSISSAERLRARHVAESALEYAKLRLEQTHQGLEGVGGGNKTPYWDAPGEFVVDQHPREWGELIGLDGKRYMADPKGDMWSIDVRDEQSYVNANSAPPFFWGALVGRGQLLADVSPSDRELELDDAEGFPEKNGEAVVGFDVIPYQKRDGNRLLGAQMKRAYKAGTFVINRLAYDLAGYGYKNRSANGGYRTLATVTAIKEVAQYGLHALDERDLDRIFGPLTVHNHRSSTAGWLAPQRVINEVKPEDFEAEKGGQPVIVTNPDYFSRGTIVRLSDGTNTEYNVVSLAGRQGDRQGLVRLLEQVRHSYDYETATLTAEMRHPVNVNACSREVLVLLLEGLEYSAASDNPSRENRVSAALAGEVADVIIKNRPVRGMEHFVDLLSALFHVKRGTFTGSDGNVTRSMVTTGGGGNEDFTPAMALAIVQNALNPNATSLVSSTMPFAFASHDYFTVETSASVNDGGSNERARHRLRETFKTAPRSEQRLVLATQADFEESIVAGRFGRYVLTHPSPLAYPTFFTSKPENRLFRNMLYFDDPDRRGFFADTETGDVRLQPARLTTVRAGDFEEHFDGDIQGAVAVGVRGENTGQRPEDIVPEGYPLSRGAYELPLEGRGGAGTPGPNSGAIADANGMSPFVIEFFMKPDSWGSGPSLFSVAGDDPQTEYVRAWYEPSDRSFHLKVHDNTVDVASLSGSGFEEAAELVWSPPNQALEDDTWYHFALHVGGTGPNDLSLQVDGMNRGEVKFVSKLSAAFSDADMTFEVEDAEDWPDQGAFWIGTEVVHAVRQSGNSYRVFENPLGAFFLPGGRGVRGSDIISHPVGETVRPFGYSSVLSRFDAAAGEVLPEGGGQLASPLNPLSVCGIKGTSTMPLPPTGISVEILDLSSTNQIELLAFPNNGNLAQDTEAFQTSGGYALVVAAAVPTGNITSFAQIFQNPTIQLVRYTSRSGSMLQGVQSVSDPFNPSLANGTLIPYQTTGGPAYPQGAIPPNMTFYHSALQTIVTRNPGLGPTAPPLAAIFPISVDLTDVEGYRDVEVNQDGPVPEFIQLGTPLVITDLTAIENHIIEWVGYHGVDRQNQVLLANSEAGIRSASDIAWQHILGIYPQQQNAPARPDVGALDRMSDYLLFRSRAETEQFGGWTDPADQAAIHASGSEAIPVFRTSPGKADQTAIIPATPVAEGPGVSAAGFGDNVTLLSEVDNLRTRHSVSWSWGRFVALTENTRGRVNQIALAGARGNTALERRRYTRLVKFPSGELPNIRQPGGEAFVGGAIGGGVTSGGFLDEIRVRGLEPGQYVVWDDGLMGGGAGQPPDPWPIITDDATEIPVCIGRWVPDRIAVAQGTEEYLPDGREVLADELNVPVTLQDAGLIRIGDEIIAYRGVNGSGILENCERGVLGTQPEEHSYGDPVVILDWRPVTRLSSQAQPDEWNFLVESLADFNPNGGTLRINDELIHYTRALGQAFSMPSANDPVRGNDVGIFRGRYGTRIGSHGTDSIVIDWPFRYWDRYAPESDDPELSFYEFSVNEPRAFFRSLRWRHEFRKNYIGLKLLCRLDPTVPWETPPERSGGRLILLESKAGQTEEHLNQALLNLNGRGMEVRVFFTYEPNAYEPTDSFQNAWKETPHLLDVDLRYVSAPLIFSREVLR